MCRVYPKKSGGALVQNVGTTMDEIVHSVQRVRDIIGEVNYAVNQRDPKTQQNAALVEESAAAASSLREQARRLAQAVSVFRLSD